MRQDNKVKIHDCMKSKTHELGASYSTAIYWSNN